jgi:hypothetical protein
LKHATFANIAYLQLGHVYDWTKLGKGPQTLPCYRVYALY